MTGLRGAMWLTLRWSSNPHLFDSQRHGPLECPGVPHWLMITGLVWNCLSTHLGNIQSQRVLHKRLTFEMINIATEAFDYGEERE